MKQQRAQRLDACQTSTLYVAHCVHVEVTANVTDGSVSCIWRAHSPLQCSPLAMEVVCEFAFQGKHVRTIRARGDAPVKPGATGVDESTCRDPSMGFMFAGKHDHGPLADLRDSAYTPLIRALEVRAATIAQPRVMPLAG